MTTTRQGHLPVHGTELYYERQGDGPALLLLHAGIADRRMWDPQFEVLAATHDVIRFDLRGFGHSKIPPGEFCNHADVEGLLDGLGVERATLLGCSFGGSIALDFALAHPDRVEALILVAPSVGGTPPSERIQAFFTEEEELYERGEYDAATEVNLRMWVDGPHRQPSDVDPEVRELVRQMQLEIFQQDFPDDDDLEEVELEPPAAGRLGEIRVPTLVVVGDLDLEEKVAQAEQVSRQIEGARCEVISGAAHVVNLEKPQEFLRAVSRFLEEQAG